MTDEEQQKLTVMIVEMSSKIEILLDKQDELADNISKIRKPSITPTPGSMLVYEIWILESFRLNRGRRLTTGSCGLLAVRLWVF